MYIDWATLAVVAIVAAAAAVTVVLLVAFALVGLSARAARRAGDPGRGGRVTSRTRLDGGTLVAALCVLTAALIVCYGLYLVVV
jgi:hypothetical protein